MFPADMRHNNNSSFLKQSHRAESQQTENPTQSDHAGLSLEQRGVVLTKIHIQPLWTRQHHFPPKRRNLLPYTG